MLTPKDLGWGDPRDLHDSAMTTVEVHPGHKVRLRNTDVGAVMTELVRRLRAAGWSGPDQQLDEWGYARRLKRWAEALGHQLATAPLSEWSDHAWGTALDLDTATNPLLPTIPANMWEHTTMPRTSAQIATGLGLEWGGTWTEPWDPQHFQVAVSPDRLREIATNIKAAEDLNIADTEDKSFLNAKFGRVVERLDLIRLGDNPDPASGRTHPGNLDTIVRKINEVLADLDQIKRRLDNPG